MRETSRFEYQGSEFWERSVEESRLELGPHDALSSGSAPLDKLSGYGIIFENQVIGGHLVDGYVKEGWTGLDGNDSEDGKNGENNGAGKTRKWRTVYLHIKG
jgi:hypothetical protein